MRKIIALAAVLLLSMSCLFALQGLVTWTWFENDPNVEYFRYQLDGEEEDKWTVVDWSVNEVTLILDITEVHELHLQQSYDGENWSESSIVESEVFAEDAFDSPSEEDVSLEEDAQTEEVTEEVESPSSEEPSAEAQEQVPEETAEQPAAPEEPKYLPIKALDYGIGYLNAIPDGTEPRTLGLFVSYTRTFKAVSVFDVGLKANAAFYSSADIFYGFSSAKLVGYANVLALASVRIENCDIYLGFGPDFGYNLVNDQAIRGGLSAELGIRYHRFKNLNLGLAFSDHQYLFPTGEAVNRFDVRIFFGSSF